MRHGERDMSPRPFCEGSEIEVVTRRCEGTIYFNALYKIDPFRSIKGIDERQGRGSHNARRSVGYMT